MAKSFLQFLSEAPMPPPPPMGGPLGGAPPVGGGLPPPPPPMGGLGGLGGPPLGSPPGMGGDAANQQPVPVKTIDAMDVWKLLREAMKDMEQHQELNIRYDRKKKNHHQEKPKKSGLLK